MDALAALDDVVGALPGGGETRPGQRTMAAAVERAIASGRHLVAQAGTGTGKSLAYLVPAIESGCKVVVATATRALQDQLVGKDLPFLAAQLERPFDFRALKGRSNYLCWQRAREALADADQLALDVGGAPAVADQVRRLVEWAATSGTETGDRAELPFEPATRAWAAVSVSARECPGASRCPSGDACFAERVRDAAHAADVIVVNTHLYGAHLASGRVMLPVHDVVVFDEAHQLEEVVADTAGFEISAGSFAHLGRAVAGVLSDPRLLQDLGATGGQLSDALAAHYGRRVRRADGALAAVLEAGRGRVAAALAALRRVDSDVGDVAARKSRAVKAATTLADEIDAFGALSDAQVAWVEGTAETPRLRVAPIEVTDTLAPLWDEATVVLTSATIPARLNERLGIPYGKFDVIDVGSPFDFAAHAVLYCAAHLPDPRSAAYEAASHDELAALVDAAGGRTLALFTSWRAMTAAVDALRPRLAFTVLAQGDLPKPALVAAFAADEATCLFATISFWQGVDVPGPTLSLVTIDRLPFPRPDEPRLQARRERARQNAFEAVDLPRAAMLLAQGAGRLVRAADDRGVVAVLDPRLARARYRWDLVHALPPMRRTRDRAEAERFLHAVVAGHEVPPVQ
ncbi:MAG: ATP-dependent DNA helicase [Acidimicrobiia bacterium]